MEEAYMPPKNGVTRRSPQTESRERDEELLDTLLRSFEVARQNLRDTQLSPDTALIYYYEAAALSLRRENTQGHYPQREADARRAFEATSTLGDVLHASASQLLELSDEDDKFIVLSFHARYNLIVLDHRLLESTMSEPGGTAKLRVVRDEYLALSKQLATLVEDASPLRPSLARRLRSSLTGVSLAVDCGILACDYALLVAAGPALNPFEKQERTKAISQSSAQIRAVLEKVRRSIRSADLPESQNPLFYSIVTSVANIEKKSATV
jgi:hypothetical protein